MKNVRTGRRRKNSPGTKRTGIRAAQALTAGAAIAAGTQAYAEPVRFNNPPHGDPGHFHWAEPNPPVGAGFLDVTQPASAQPAPAFMPPVFGHRYGAGWGMVETPSGQANALQVGLDPIYGVAHLLHGVAGGELVPSGTPWHFYGYTRSNYYGSSLPEGMPTYLGLKFDAGSGYQYGWIGVIRTVETLEAFAWGYETEPGVPVPAGAPEPGTLALLAFGAIGLLRRRRQ